MKKPVSELYDIAVDRVAKIINRSKFPIQPTYAYAKACYDFPFDAVFCYWKDRNRTKHGLDPEVNKRLQTHPNVHAIRGPKGKVIAYVSNKYKKVVDDSN